MLNGSLISLLGMLFSLQWVLGLLQAIFFADQIVPEAVKNHNLYLLCFFLSFGKKVELEHQQLQKYSNIPPFFLM